MQGDAVIVEVGLNEAVSPASHPHVPQTPQECGADALRCSGAGASVVHWHAVDASGAQRLGDASIYGEALDAMAGAVLAYPSYPTDVPDEVDARLGHCFDLRRDHGLEIAPIDVATVNLVLPDGGPREPMDGFEVIRNSMPFVHAALARYQEIGLVPTLAAFDVGCTRAIGTLATSEAIPQPVLLKIFLWGSPIIGPEPSVEALDLHLRQLPEGVDVEWVVVPYGIADPDLVEEIARAALERGGGVRLGIGDAPHAFPRHTNPHLVELAATWAAEAGRPLASADDLRTRLGTTHP